MRRLGITPSPAVPIPIPIPNVKGKEKEIQPEQEPAAIPPVIIEDRSFSTTPSLYKRPYLSIPTLGAPHPTPAHLASGRVDRAGVEERLKTLREVDDGIWNLIEDLTRLKSQWDSGHDNPSSRDGDGAGDVGTSSEVGTGVSVEVEDQVS